jgi:hypothetical protein
MIRIGWRDIFSVVALFLALAVCSFAGVRIFQSIWASSPLAIDGRGDDWQGDPLALEKKVKVEYAFRNDVDTLYVFFKFDDLKYLSSIEFTGMTLWIDPGGKKDKYLGINFTKKKISADEYIAMLERTEAVSEEQKEKLRASAFYFISKAEAMDKKGNPLEPEQSAEAVKGAAYNVSVGQDTATYEFRVPIAHLTGAEPESGAETGAVVGVGFEWGGLTDEIRESFMKGSAVGDSGPMGISEGGRGGGGGQSTEFEGASPEGLTALRKMTKKYSFWTEVRLARSRQE